MFVEREKEIDRVFSVKEKIRQSIRFILGLKTNNQSD